MMLKSMCIPVLPDLIFAGNIIEWVKEFEYLGLAITDNLSFTKQTGNVLLNISCISGILKKLWLIVPSSILIRGYFGVAHPHLTNHLIIWGAALSYEVERRALFHQLVVLYESLPTDALNLAMNILLRRFKVLLYETQF